MEKEAGKKESGERKRKKKKPFNRKVYKRAQPYRSFHVTNIQWGAMSDSLHNLGLIYMSVRHMHEAQKE